MLEAVERQEGQGLRFYYVRHAPFSWYKKHPDIIDTDKPSAEKNTRWKGIRSFDKVVYYCYEPPTGIVGLFEVKSNGDIKSIKDASAPLSWYYEISPLFLAIEGGKPREFSPWNDAGLRLPPRGVVVELKPDEYREIKKILLEMDEPTNEQGVVALFMKIHKYLGFQEIKRIGTQYPDATVIDHEGKEKRIEFEFDSDSFRTQGHDPKECDVIVCWKDRVGLACPKRLEVIALQPLYGSESV